ncbi:hypothetical protein MnBA_38170 [Marinobacterium sp. BA1]
MVLLVLLLVNLRAFGAEYTAQIGPPVLDQLMTLKQRYWFDAAKAEHLGEWDVMLDTTSRWHRMRPNDIELWVYRARAFTGLERYQEAESAYQRVLERYPNEDFLYFALAELSLRQGRAEQACDHIATALSIHPGYADALAFQELNCEVSQEQAAERGFAYENTSD